MIGIANFLLVIVPSFWGIRLLTHSSIEKPFLRLIFLSIGVILFSSSVTRISAPEFWSISSGLGGALGPIVFNQILLLVEPLSITSDFRLSVSIYRHNYSTLVLGCWMGRVGQNNT